jgi:E3 ubiquitin-protein ligase listerin
MEKMLPMLSTAVLRSAWVEPDAAVRGVMWQPLLTFLKGVAIVYCFCNSKMTDAYIEFPDAWNLAGADKTEDRDENGSHSEDSEEETNDIVQQPQQVMPHGITSQSIAYQEFLQFLELGCSGSPSQGYPTIVIILSTITSPVRSNAQIFEYTFINIFGCGNRSLRPSQISLTPSGQQLTVVLSAPSTAQPLLPHSYPLYLSARFFLSGVFGAAQ